MWRLVGSFKVDGAVAGAQEKNGVSRAGWFSGHREGWPD